MATFTIDQIMVLLLESILSLEWKTFACLFFFFSLRTLLSFTDFINMSEILEMCSNIFSKVWGSKDGTRKIKKLMPLPA